MGTLYCGGYLMSSNGMTAGDLTSFLVATQTIQRSMAQMSLLFGSFVKGIQAGGRVFQVSRVHFINCLEGCIPLHVWKYISTCSIQIAS